MGASIERRLAALLVADVAGYSRLMGRDEAGTLAALQASRSASAGDQVVGHSAGQIGRLAADIDQSMGTIRLLHQGSERIGGVLDVIKAVALGADAVLLGRPYVYGLAVAGQEGVETVIRQLAGELDLTMALAGARTVAELDRSFVV